MAAVLDWFRPKGRHHAITEASPGKTVALSPSKSVVRAGYTYGVPPGGLNDVQTGMGAATQTDRKSLMQELYEAYISCPWAWASVQSIARTITAGGLVTEWAADDGEGDQDIPDKPESVLALEALLEFVNPQQNIRQLVRNFIADLLVFGDAYIEVVWIGSRPVALYNQDSPTTTPIADEHGVISGYVQVTDYGDRVEFKPHEIIHVTLDAARPGVTGLSPMQAALGPVTTWLFAAATGKEAFKKGLPPNLHADFPATTKETDVRKWRDQYLTRNVGARNLGSPITSQGGMAVKELQTGKISDVINGKNQARDEILSIFGVPPAKAGVIESGNLGGGTGEAQDKTYRVDTCGPIDELVIEALNYALCVKAFGITDWRLKFGEIDYRDSQIIENIRDSRLRNGSWTLNRYRQEIGEPPVDGGDDAVLVDRQNLVLWSQMAQMSQANITAKASKGNQPQPAALPPGVTPPGQPPDPDGQGQGDPQQAAPATTGEPADHQALPPPDGKPAKGKGGKPRESVTSAQMARYQARLREALAAFGETTTAADVTAFMADRFPAAKLGWVADATWQGPMAVPLDQIDMSNRATWAASHDDNRVAKLRRKLRKKLADGDHPKPAVLVRTPGSDKDIVIDGHHHLLAAEAEGQATLWAYVGHVDAKTGPWDELHSSQRETAPGVAFKVSPESVNYRLAVDPLQSCGTCAMNQGGVCDRITGRVENDHSCDVWVAPWPEHG